MRLRKLDLQAFGSLRDVTLDFSQDAPCLHVIYGPNEAGKSTALRALTGLFYGIPHNTKDAHSVEPSGLRIGALLRDASGRELYVLRRKGRKDTLRARDDKTALSAEDAVWISAGVHASTFDTQFGLNFETLHRGAEELLGSGGDLGQSLFAAAANGGHVRRVLEALTREADSLFRPKAKNMPLNEAINRFESQKKQIRELATKADVFEKQQSEIESSAARCRELDEQLTALRAERARLERVRRILPILNRQRARRAERVALGEVVLLPTEAAQERQLAVAARRDAQLGLEHARAEIARLQQQREALQQVVRPELLELSGERCERLREELSIYRDGLRKLPSRSEALARAQAEVERARLALQLPTAEPAAVERLRLPKSHEVRAREQLRQGEAARAQTLACARKLADTQDALARVQRKRAQLWAGDGQSLPASARAALPSEELCSQYEQRFAELDRRQQKNELARQSALEAIEQNERERQELRLHGVPPSEVDLQERRGKRDQALQALRVELVESLPFDAGRAVAYLERALALGEQADELADRMRREAERVAHAAALETKRGSLRSGLERVHDEAKALEAGLQRLTAEWQSRFQAAGVPVRLPRECLRLLGMQRELDLQHEQLERELASDERAHASAQQAQRALSERWRELVQALGVPENTSAAELETLLSARSELLQRYDAARALADELHVLTQGLRAFEAETAALSAAHQPELCGQPAETAAARLVAAHAQTHGALQQIRELERALSDREQTAERAQRELAQAQRWLTALMQAAGVDEPGALELVEQRSARARELDAELARDAADLAAECGVHDAEALVAEVGLSIDEVRFRLEAIVDEQERLEQERVQQNQQLASLRLGLDRLHERHGAGDAAANAALHLEDVRTLSERYIRLRLAAGLLRREIEHYRERHRGPVLDAAATWFSRLTLGAYTGLDVDYDDHGQPVLMCVRGDQRGKRLDIAALSTGTRDQLYLALRLASIEHLGRQRELMPLILDDILVHFDDARARAALCALAEFAATTQVLFFTHHAHLCELAKQALPDGRVQFHRLSASASAGASQTSLQLGS